MVWFASARPNSSACAALGLTMGRVCVQAARDVGVGGVGVCGGVRLPYRTSLGHHARVDSTSPGSIRMAARNASAISQLLHSAIEAKVCFVDCTLHVAYSSGSSWLCVVSDIGAPMPRINERSALASACESGRESVDRKRNG